jgi:hypothetical protein
MLSTADEAMLQNPNFPVTDCPPPTIPNMTVSYSRMLPFSDSYSDDFPRDPRGPNLSTSRRVAPPEVNNRLGQTGLGMLAVPSQTPPIPVEERRNHNAVSRYLMVANALKDRNDVAQMMQDSLCIGSGATTQGMMTRKTSRCVLGRKQSHRKAPGFSELNGTLDGRCDISGVTGRAGMSLLQKLYLYCRCLETIATHSLSYQASFWSRARDSDTSLWRNLAVCGQNGHIHRSE